LVPPRFIYAVGLGIGEQLLAREQVPLPPGGDDLDVGLERIGAQLEAHLVVALAGGAVGDGVRTRLVGDLHQPLGDQGTGDGGSQQVLALVERVGPEHGVDEVPHELLAQVVDVDLLDTRRLGLGARRLDLLALADVCGEGDHLALVVLFQPLEDDGGIQPPRVGEDDLLDLVLGHTKRSRWT